MKKECNNLLSDVQCRAVLWIGLQDYLRLAIHIKVNKCVSWESEKW